MKAKRRIRGPIRVLVADDHVLFCESLCQALQSDANIEILSCLHDLDMLRNAIEEYQPDVVLLDLSFPQCSSIDAIESLCRQTPAPSIVVLSMYTDADAVVRSQQAGALGFVAKGDDLDTLRRAIEHVHAKKAFLSPQVERTSGYRLVDFSLLSNRECQVVALRIQGLTLVEVAARLEISYKTAHMHQHSALKRTGLSSITKLIHAAKLASRFTTIFEMTSPE